MSAAKPADAHTNHFAAKPGRRRLAARGGGRYRYPWCRRTGQSRPIPSAPWGTDAVTARQTALEDPATMQMLMQPGMVYEYPLWGVGLLLAGAAAFGAVLLGLVVRPCLSLEFRRRHNDVAAAIFTVIGTTFAVLLAFVAMLAWEHFNDAKSASYAEAGAVLDVYNASAGFADPQRSAMRD